MKNSGTKRALLPDTGTGIGAPLADSVLPNAIRCCKEPVNGTAGIIEMDDPLKL